jgi:phospholipid/cholesterol/gamma-HCH transport system substrate-binding protein
MATSRELRVGIFVLAGLAVAGTVIFLIGDEKRLFDSKVTFHTSFRDVQGLKVGSAARLGGIDIGTVSRVEHGKDPSDTRLYVDLHIVKSESVRIREDAVVRIAAKGLLGDKMVEIDGGSVSRPPIPPGGNVRGEDPTNYMNLFNDVSSMVGSAHKLLNNLETLSGTLADSGMQNDLKSGVSSASSLLREMSQGNGYVHRLLTDPVEAERFSHTIQSFDRAATEMQQTLAETHKVVAQINQGPGLLHEIAYGQQGSDTVAKFGSAAGELAATLKGIREGNGMAHSLLYGGDDASKHFSENLDAMSRDLRQIVADLRAGKGTLGALLVDPSIYEDVKSVLGNVKRNDTLRALVRYSIKQDEKRPGVQVSGPTEAKESPSSVPAPGPSSP